MNPFEPPNDIKNDEKKSTENFRLLFYLIILSTSLPIYLLLSWTYENSIIVSSFASYLFFIQFVFPFLAIICETCEK